MNWGRVLCGLGRHSLTQWRSYRTPIHSGAADVMGTALERHCKRKICAYAETRPLRKREPNAADTVQRVKP